MRSVERKFLTGLFILLSLIEVQRGANVAGANANSSQAIRNALLSGEDMEPEETLEVLKQLNKFESSRKSSELSKSDISILLEVSKADFCSAKSPFLMEHSKWLKYSNLARYLYHYYKPKLNADCKRCRRCAQFVRLYEQRVKIKYMWASLFNGTETSPIETRNILEIYWDWLHHFSHESPEEKNLLKLVNMGETFFFSCDPHTYEKRFKLDHIPQDLLANVNIRNYIDYYRNIHHNDCQWFIMSAKERLEQSIREDLTCADIFDKNPHWLGLKGMFGAMRGILLEPEVRCTARKEQLVIVKSFVEVTSKDWLDSCGLMISGRWKNSLPNYYGKAAAHFSIFESTLRDICFTG